MYIYVVHGGRDRVGRLLPKAEIHYVPGEYELFYSVFGLDLTGSPAAAPEQHWPPCAGTCHADFLYFIIRRPQDAAGALRAAQRLVERLLDCFDVHLDALLLYYSGDGGFDIGLPQSLFAGFAPHPALPQQLNALSRLLLTSCFGLVEETLRIFEATLQQLPDPRHFADVVPDFYAPTQLLRAPNSWHGRTGTYKVPLRAWELLTCSLPRLHQLAAQPRPTFQAARPYASYPAHPTLTELWRRVRS